MQPATFHFTCKIAIKPAYGVSMRLTSVGNVNEEIRASTGNIHVNWQRHQLTNSQAGFSSRVRLVWLGFRLMGLGLWFTIRVSFKLDVAS